MRKSNSSLIYNPIVFPKRLTKNCYPFNSRVSITNQSDVKTRKVYSMVPIMTAFDMRPKDSAQWWQPWTVLALVSQPDGSSEDVRNHECRKTRDDSKEKVLMHFPGKTFFCFHLGFFSSEVMLFKAIFFIHLFSQFLDHEINLRYFPNQKCHDSNH